MAEIAKDTLVMNSGRIRGGELMTLADIITSVTQVSAVNTGSNTTQFSFFNTLGTAITGPRFIECYMSDVNGAPITAITSLAAATNGFVDPLVTGKIHNCITSATGLLGILFTGSTNHTRFCTFVLPNGKLLISTLIDIN